MTVMSTLDVKSLTAPEYRAVVDQMGVETQPAPGIYLHIATETEFGIRVIELWDQREGFERFLQNRLVPATEAVHVHRETAVSVEPLHNLFAPRLEQIPALAGKSPPKVVTTLDVSGLTPLEFRAILERMGVEANPEPAIYLHLTAPTATGFRIVELWDSAEQFQDFAERRLTPATRALGIERPTTVHFTPLLNLFAPRLRELPALVSSLPGGPKSP